MMLRLILAGVLFSAFPQEASSSCDLLDLSTSLVDKPLPRGWQVRAVRGGQAPSLAVIDSAGARFLRTSGVARAAWFVRELDTPWRGVGTQLSWSWRIGTVPIGADLTSAKRDDSALRVFVVFARTSRFARTPRTIFYTSQTVGHGALERPSFSGNDLHVIGISTPTAVHGWMPMVVSPMADYRRIWKNDPPAIVAIGFMQDSDQTRSFALADLMSLCLERDATSSR